MHISDWSSDVCSSDLASAGRNVFALLGPLAGGLFDRATMHVPVSIVEEALVAAKEIGADFTVAIGGGSTTGLPKALSLRAGLPSLVIPTTRSLEHTSEFPSIIRISYAFFCM